MGGEQVLFYQRRWSGTRCPNYSQIKKTHAVDTDQNDGCFGTGWVGGYYRPIPIYISLLSANAIQNVVQEDGIKKSFQPKSWSLHEPTFRNGDFFVRNSTNERYWITDVTPTRWRSKILRQTFSADLIERSHPVYLISV